MPPIPTRSGFETFVVSTESIRLSTQGSSMLRAGDAPFVGASPMIDLRSITTTRRARCAASCAESAIWPWAILILRL